MLEVFVHISEVILVCLIAKLSIRTHTLYKKEYCPEDEQVKHILHRLMKGSTAENPEYEVKMESLKKAQIFAGMQLLEIKRSYGDLNQANLNWLREAISLYLIGAIDLIGKQATCSAKSRKELITLVLKSNLNLTSEHTTSYFNEALYRQLSSDNDLMVRAGAKAAKSWLSKEAIPNDMSLSSRLDDWGVFA